MRSLDTLFEKHQVKPIHPIVESTSSIERKENTLSPRVFVFPFIIIDGTVKVYTKIISGGYFANHHCALEVDFVSSIDKGIEDAIYRHFLVKDEIDRKSIKIKVQEVKRNNIQGSLDIFYSAILKKPLKDSTLTDALEIQQFAFDQGIVYNDILSLYFKDSISLIPYFVGNPLTWGEICQLYNFICSKKENDLSNLRKKLSSMFVIETLEKKAIKKGRPLDKVIFKENL